MQKTDMRGVVADRKWLLVDAEGKVLGRLASRIATILQGKHRPSYVPHIDTGDHVIVVNAAKIVLTGNKAKNKVYKRHTGYVGHLREESVQEVLESKPEEVILRAVKRMLPKSKLGNKMFTKLKVYSGSDHPHAAQNPESMEI